MRADSKHGPYLLHRVRVPVDLVLSSNRPRRIAGQLPHALHFDVSATGYTDHNGAYTVIGRHLSFRVYLDVRTLQE